MKTMFLIVDFSTTLLLLVRLELLALDSIFIGNLLPAQQMSRHRLDMEHATQSTQRNLLLVHLLLLLRIYLYRLY